jgi:hypothetical protein
MFKWLFYHWYSSTDLPSINARVNIWSYVNIKIFKSKMQNQIVYFILGLNNLYLKELKIFYKNASFEVFYFKIIYILIFLILSLVFLSLF